MHPLFESADGLSHKAIGAAIEVRRILGPGLLESIYEKCRAREWALRGMVVETQRAGPITYKEETFTEPLRFDLLVDRCLLIEVKTAEKILPIHKVQVLRYLKLLQLPLALLINFNEDTLVQGVSRLVLPGAGRPASLPSVQK